MNPPKKMKTSNNNAAGNSNNSNNFTRKPRRSIKAEGNCLNALLREGSAKVIDASKLGKRLSSEIWNSFGAIQVDDSFTYPSIDTKTVADGSSTLKICQFFVACSKCFSVFKYDGHAYGTTGLVKHVKICLATIESRATSNQTSFTSSNTNFDHSIDNTHTPSSVPNNSVAVATITAANSNNNTTTTIINGPVATRRRREPNSTPTKARQAQQPSLRHMAKTIEELKYEVTELKQRINELINIMSGTIPVGQIQIISNDGDKVEDELQKTD